MNIQFSIFTFDSHHCGEHIVKNNDCELVVYVLAQYVCKPFDE